MIEIIIIILITIFVLISRFGKNDTVYGSVKSIFDKHFFKTDEIHNPTGENTLLS